MALRTIQLPGQDFKTVPAPLLATSTSAHVLLVNTFWIHICYQIARGAVLRFMGGIAQAQTNVQAKAWRSDDVSHGQQRSGRNGTHSKKLNIEMPGCAAFRQHMLQGARPRRLQSAAVYFL